MPISFECWHWHQIPIGSRRECWPLRPSTETDVASTAVAEPSYVSAIVAAERPWSVGERFRHRPTGGRCESRGRRAGLLPRVRRQSQRPCPAAVRRCTEGCTIAVWRRLCQRRTSAQSPGQTGRRSGCWRTCENAITFRVDMRRRASSPYRRADPCDLVTRWPRALPSHECVPHGTARTRRLC